MRLPSALCLLAMVLACACNGSNSHAVSVEAITDLVAGAEFAVVQTDLLDPNAGDEAASVLAHQERSTPLATSFGHGLRVAEFDTELSQSIVRVRLTRRDGSLLVENSVRANFSGDSVVRVYLTRGCVGVRCPTPGGASSALTSCLGGVCVSDTCDPAVPATCGEVSLCTTDASCPDVSGCATKQCVDGVCIAVARAVDACSADEWCNPDPELGCEPLPSEMPPVDAGEDAAVEVDAGPEDAGVDASVPCGALCVLPDEPCTIAFWDCAGATPVCAPASRWPAGHECGTDHVCDDSGACNECFEGASCRWGCVVGTTLCASGIPECYWPWASTLVLAPVGTSCSVTDLCVDAGGHPCGTGSVCTDDARCVPCVDGVECALPDCSRGVVDCSSAGRCVATSGTASVGTACEFTTTTAGTVVRASAYCDAVGACVTCAHNVACDTGDPCRGGHTDCALGPDACMPDSLALRSGDFGATCPAGVCDGYGSCTPSFEVLDVALESTYGCAVANDGHVWCWGAPADDSLFGTSGAPSAGTMQEIASVSNAVDVDVSATRACARRADGTVSCWGTASPTDATVSPTPLDVVLPDDAIAMGVGAHHECFLLADKTVACWGSALYNGTSTDNGIAPIRVPGVANVDRLSVSNVSTCAVIHDGSVQCWGEDVFDGPARLPYPLRQYAWNYPGVDASEPILMNAVEVSVADDMVCVVQDAGVRVIYCHGDPSYPTPYGSYLTALNFVPPFDDPVDVTVGDVFPSLYSSVPFYVACTRRPSGEVWCLGNKNGIPGAPGDGPLPLASNWHRVLEFETQSQVAIGSRVTCARDLANALVCWGAGNDTDIAAGSAGLKRTFPTYVPAP